MLTCLFIHSAEVEMGAPHCDGKNVLYMGTHGVLSTEVGSDQTFPHTLGRLMGGAAQSKFSGKVHTVSNQPHVDEGKRDSHLCIDVHKEEEARKWLALFQDDKGKFDTVFVEHLTAACLPSTLEILRDTLQPGAKVAIEFSFDPYPLKTIRAHSDAVRVNPFRAYFVPEMIDFFKHGSWEGEALQKAIDFVINNAKIYGFSKEEFQSIESLTKAVSSAQYDPHRLNFAQPDDHEFCNWCSMNFKTMNLEVENVEAVNDPQTYDGAFKSYDPREDTYGIKLHMESNTPPAEATLYLMPLRAQLLANFMVKTNTNRAVYQLMQVYSYMVQCDAIKEFAERNGFRFEGLFHNLGRPSPINGRTNTFYCMLEKA